MDNESTSQRSQSKSPGSKWRWASASRQGRNHAMAKIDCQDAHRVLELSHGVLIAVVADGAGSAPRSRDGADAAVNILSDFLAKFLIPEQTTEEELADLLKRAYIYVSGAIQLAANHDGSSLSDYHTTLSCAVVTPASLAVAQIGDGAIVCWDHLGQMETVAIPEHGEYSNSTFFVTELPQRLDRLHIRVMARKCQGIALTTDGLVDIAFENPLGNCQPWAPFFEPLIDRIRTAAADEALSSRLSTFLGSPKISESTTDDLTLVIAVRRESSAPAEDTEVTTGSSMDSDALQRFSTPNHAASRSSQPTLL